MEERGAPAVLPSPLWAICWGGGHRQDKPEKNREEIFTFPPHAHFEALLEATVLALVAVVLVYGTVPVGPASVR